MNKYKILNVESVHDFAESLIGMTFEGEWDKGYINLHTCDGDILFSRLEVEVVIDINDITWDMKDMERCKNPWNNENDVIIDGETKKLTIFSYDSGMKYFAVLKNEDIYENKFFEVKTNNNGHTWTVA